MIIVVLRQLIIHNYSEPLAGCLSPYQIVFLKIRHADTNCGSLLKIQKGDEPPSAERRCISAVISRQYRANALSTFFCFSKIGHFQHFGFDMEMTQELAEQFQRGRVHLRYAELEMVFVSITQPCQVLQIELFLFNIKYLRDFNSHLRLSLGSTLFSDSTLHAASLQNSSTQLPLPSFLQISCLPVRW
jgi:hypothetical protein